MDPALVTVTASDGYRLTYRHWTPPEPATASLVLLNGIMSNSAWFSPITEPLLHAGIELVGADRRGSGPNREGRGDAPSAGQLVQDVLTIVGDAVAPGRPLVMLGWCWGAALAVAAAHKLSQRVCGLVLVTPGMFNLPAIHEAMEAQKERIAAAGESDPVVDSPIREEWFTDGPALDRFILQDPDRVSKMTPRMVAVTSKLVISALARLRTLPMPMLVLLAADEQATDNEATRQALSRIPPERLDVRTLPSKHGMQFDVPDAVAAAIRGFVQQTTSAS